MKFLGITTISKDITGEPFWYVIEKNGTLVSGSITGNLEDLGDGHQIKGVTIEDWYNEFQDVIYPIDYKTACIMMLTWCKLKVDKNNHFKWNFKNDVFGKTSLTVDLTKMIKQLNYYVENN